MNKLLVKINPEVEKVFNIYLEMVRNRLLNIRRLIIETANEIEDIDEIEDTLKWNEPSYLVKIGSTIRIDWKKINPINMRYISNVQVS